MSRILTISLVIIFIFVVGKFGGMIGQKIAQDENKYTFDLKEVALETNKKTPLTVDNETVLINVTSTDSTLDYHYKLINLTTKDISIDDFNNLVIDINIGYCTKDEMKIYRENSINMTYFYVDKNNNPLKTISTNFSDCNNILKDKAKRDLEAIQNGGI